MTSEGGRFRRNVKIDEGLREVHDASERDVRA